MKTIITIDYHHFLVADPKKALAVIQTLSGARRVQASGYNEFTFLDDTLDVSMQTLSDKVAIKNKPTKKTREERA